MSNPNSNLFPESNRFLVYHKDVSGNELYDYTRDAQNFFKKINNYDDTWEDQYYAKKADGTEYIPNNKLIAFQERFPVYPLTKNNEIYFPKNDDGDEMWFYMERTGTVIHPPFGRAMPSVGRYPKNKSGVEIYPISIQRYHDDDRNIDVISYFENHIRMNYAKDENGNVYYPLDTNGNEYIFSKQHYLDNIKNFNDYPVSKTGTVIVPNINGTPYFVQHFKTKVTINDIIGDTKIYHPNDESNFETNVKPVQQQQQNRRPEMNGKYFYVLSREKNVLHDTLNLVNTTPTSSPSNTTNLVKDNNNNNNKSAKKQFFVFNFWDKLKSSILYVIIFVCVIIFMVSWYIIYFLKDSKSKFD